MSPNNLPENKSVCSDEYKKLTVAFLGGGLDSAVGRVHQIAVEMDQRFELLAGCFSRNEVVNRQAAQQYGVELNRVYNNLEDLIENEVGKIDAIVILTPTDQHMSQVQACLVAGIPVICEKALVSSSDEALVLKDMLKQHRGFLAVTYNYTGYPMLRELRQMIHDGKLGRIHHIQIEMPQEGFVKLGEDNKPMTPQDWRLRDDKVPTISLDLGVHLDLMIRFLVNEKPLDLVAGSNTFGNFNQVIDDVWCIANYSNGLTCNIWYSKVALGYRNGLRVRVFGEKGAGEWHQENPEYLNLADCYGSKQIVDRASPNALVSSSDRYTRFKAGHPSGFIEAFANYYSDVADQLCQFLRGNSLQSNPYVFGVDEALEGMKLLETIADSCAAKKWMEVR